MPVITEATPIAFSGPLPEAVDVVVIGGGIVGVSAAWFLAGAGVKGAGSASRAGTGRSFPS
jgi:glycine/D-amino acid oxidase-like deaminating enzyme